MFSAVRVATYFGNLTKVLDDLAIALDDFLLHV